MALDLGTLVARLRADNDMRAGLDQGRRDMDGFRRDVNGRLRDIRGRFASEGAAAGREFGRGLGAGGQGADQFVRDVNGRLRDVRGRFVAGGQESGRGFGDGLERESRGGVGRFGDVIQAAGKKAAAGIGQLGASLGRLAAEDPKKTVMVIGGLIAGLPLTAGIAASALTVGLGGAIAGIGIKAAASAKAVKSAFGDLQDDMKSGLREAAAPFEGSLVRMIAMARKELGGLAGPVRAAFAHLAPAVEKAFGSVSRAVGSLGPTIALIAQKAAPLVEVLGRELGILVKGLASDFARLAGAADPRFLTVLVGGLRGLSAVITEVIVKASQFGSAILDVAGHLGIDWKPPTTGAQGLGEAFMKTAAGARDASEAVQEINDALAEHFDPSIAVFNATTRIKESFQSLVTALKESKGELNGNSAAAQQARNAFAGALTSVTDLYKATVTKTGSDEKAKKAIEDQLPVLYALAGQNQGARNQVDALAKSFGMMPGAVLPAERSFLAAAKAMGLGEDQAKALFKELDRRPELKLTITDLQAKLRQAKADLDKVPKEKRPEIKAKIDDLQNKIRAAQKELDRLQSKTINVSVMVKQYGSTDALRRLSGYATGGLVEGPGTGTSDSIPAMLSRGEYVLPASVVKRVGLKSLEDLRKGKGNPPGLGDLKRDNLGDLVRSGGLGKLVRGSSSQDADLKKAIESQLKTLKAGLKKIRAEREDLLEDLTSASADSVKSAAKSMSQMVKEAFAGFRATTTVDDRLLAQISRTSQRLQTLADQRAELAERLQEALNFAAETTSRARDFASVMNVRVVDEEGNEVDANAGELRTGLQARLDTLRKFTGNMRQLAAQGLSKTMWRQLLEDGPEVAGSFAEAIAAGGQQAVNELTALQDQVDAESKALGEFGANHLYDAGAQAGQGFLTGLTGQLATLEATMENLATNLITTVTNAIAAAQKIAQEQADKIKKKEKEEGKLGDLVRGQGELGDLVRDNKKPAPGASQNISGGKRPPAPKAALHIENYHESAKGSARGTAAELLLLTKSRG